MNPQPQSINAADTSITRVVYGPIVKIQKTKRKTAELLPLAEYFFGIFDFALFSFYFAVRMS